MAVPKLCLFAVLTIEVVEEKEVVEDEEGVEVECCVVEDNVVRPLLELKVLEIVELELELLVDVVAVESEEEEEDA